MKKIIFITILFCGLSFFINSSNATTTLGNFYFGNGYGTSPISATASSTANGNAIRVSGYWSASGSGSSDFYFTLERGGTTIATSTTKTITASPTCTYFEHDFATNPAITTGETLTLKQHRTSAMVNIGSYVSDCSTYGAVQITSEITNSITFPFLTNGNEYQDLKSITTLTSFASTSAELASGNMLIYFSTSTPENASIILNAIAYNDNTNGRYTLTQLDKSLYIFGTSTTWYAYGFLYGENFQDVRASTTNYFIISAPFAPTETTSSLRYVVPFVYLYDIQEIFGNISSASTSTFPTLQLYFGSLIGTTTVLSSSSVTSLLGESNITLFRNLMAGALWVLLGYAIYNKSKNMFNS